MQRESQGPPGGSDVVGLGSGMKIYLRNKNPSWFLLMRHVWGKGIGWLAPLVPLWLIHRSSRWAQTAAFSTFELKSTGRIWICSHDLFTRSWSMVLQIVCHFPLWRDLGDAPVPKVKVDMEAKASGENPFRNGAGFSTSRHSWGLSLHSSTVIARLATCTPALRTSPHLSLSVSAAPSQYSVSSVRFHFTLNWFNTVLLGCPLHPTFVSPPDPSSWVTSSTVESSSPGPQHPPLPHSLSRC